MKITVTSHLGGEKTYTPSSFEEFQGALHADFGIPPEYQMVSLGGNKFHREEFNRLTGENVTLALASDLDGGAGGSISFRTGEFELKVRLCCAYVGLDGHWNKAQCCCVYGQCTIA
eukprot:TRINITY_DN946_c0_g1_i1.p1 TRINITY_DN946_c0_g1~~TRINITY_DN946_c0_g1_i1.p1  ORF type:complete len:116 (-),score=12.34 TRINITY_DN946_c0_g1_i1:185-532(-)